MIIDKYSRRRLATPAFVGPIRLTIPQCRDIRSGHVSLKSHPENRQRDDLLIPRNAMLARY